METLDGPPALLQGVETLLVRLTQACCKRSPDSTRAHSALLWHSTSAAPQGCSLVHCVQSSTMDPTVHQWETGPNAWHIQTLTNACWMNECVFTCIKWSIYSSLNIHTYAHTYTHTYRKGQYIMLSEKTKSQNYFIYNRIWFLKKCICVMNFWKGTF